MELDFNKIIEEKAKEYALEHVKSIIVDLLNDDYTNNLDEFVGDLVERKVDNMIEKDDFSLEDAVTNGISRAIIPWITNNLYQEDIEACIKSAILIKMQEYSLEDLIKLAESLKK